MCHSLQAENQEKALSLADSGISLRDIFQDTTQDHFCFTSSKPGVVLVKEYDSPEVQYNLVGKAVVRDLPEIIPVPGLDSKHQWYLFHQIRNFCRQDAKGLVYPRPTKPEPSHS